MGGDTSPPNLWAPHALDFNYWRNVFKKAILKLQVH